MIEYLDPDPVVLPLGAGTRVYCGAALVAEPSNYTWEPFCFSDGTEGDACSDWLAAFPALGAVEVVTVDAKSQEVPIQIVTEMRAKGAALQLLQDLIA